MTVVSDTSPLRYLVAADQKSLLTRLFGVSVIPRAVQRELQEAPHRDVQQWILQRPPRVLVRDVRGRPDTELRERLDAGEAEAIQLALELRAERIIMDERLGRQMAEKRGLTPLGALGILRESYRRGFIDNPLEVAAQLRARGFRASRALIRRFEEQIRQLQGIG